MNITPSRQIFFEDEANRAFPAGCRCSDRSGSCIWCHMYYYGPETRRPPIEIVAHEDGLWFQLPYAAICLNGHGPLVEKAINELWLALRGEP